MTCVVVIDRKATRNNELSRYAPMTAVWHICSSISDSVTQTYDTQGKGGEVRHPNFIIYLHSEELKKCPHIQFFFLINNIAM